MLVRWPDALDKQKKEAAYCNAESISAAPAAKVAKVAKAVQPGRLGGSVMLLFLGSMTDCFAHAAERGFVLLLPTGYYLLGGTLAVATSIVLAGILRRPALHLFFTVQLKIPLGSTSARFWCSAFGFTVLLLLLLTGLFGSHDPLSNPLPLSVWTLFWVCLTLAHAVAGNIWGLFNPWYAPVTLINRHLGARAVTSSHGADETEPDQASSKPALPERFVLSRQLGYLPAIAGFLLFAWFELVSLAPEDPMILVWVVSGYWLFHFAATLAFGQSWLLRGEPFSVFFRFLSLLSPFTRTNRGLTLGLPGYRLLSEPPIGWTGAAFVLVTLATVSFDGLNKTFWWLHLNGINPLDFRGRSSVTLINGAGLFIAVALLLGLYFLAIRTGWKLATKQDTHKSPQQTDSLIGDTHKSPQHSDSLIGDTHKSPQHSDFLIGDTHKSPQHSDSIIGDTRKSPQHSDSLIGDTHNSPQHSDSLIGDTHNSPQHSDSLIGDTHKSPQHSDSIIGDTHESSQYSDSIIGDTHESSQYSEALIRDTHKSHGEVPDTRRSMPIRDTHDSKAIEDTQSSTAKQDTQETFESGRRARSYRDFAGLLALAIMPISLGYHLSHYATQLLVNGQYALAAFSDPFAADWNLFNLQGFRVTTSFLSHHATVELIWRFQVIVIVAGHVFSVALAHLLALRFFDHNRSSGLSNATQKTLQKTAVLSVLPMGILMVIYTLFGLWLLSTATGA